MFLCYNLNMNKISNIITIIVLLILITAGVFFLVNKSKIGSGVMKESESLTEFSPAEKALELAHDYYTSGNLEKATRLDEVLFPTLIWSDFKLENYHDLETEPFVRLVSPERTFGISKADKNQLKDPLIQMLYCDYLGTTEDTYNKFKEVRDNQGGYDDTHFLIGALLYKKLCAPTASTVSSDIDSVVASITEAQKTDNQFSDLYAERVVVLYWAGAIDKIDSIWIQKILDAQQSDGSWKVEDNVFHITALSSLALKYNHDSKVDYPWFAK